MVSSSRSDFIHGHPLTKVDSIKAEFLCHGCGTLGFGTRYRCEPCNFNLHDRCATCPWELSSFMHEHDLKLVYNPHATCQNDRACHLCDDPVKGLFYRCNLCDFNVHPLCTQLPEFVRHVMHKDPLRLQRLVPGKCMVCKDTCSSWHYRSGICNFALHIECVLVPTPPSEATAATSTPRSLETPARPPSASPVYDARYASLPIHYFDPYSHGYGGAIPPPTYLYHGVVPPSPTPPPVSCFGPYSSCSGATPPPPYLYHGGVPPPPPPPYFGPYSQGYGATLPPPYLYHGGSPHPPPYFGSYSHGNGIPYSSADDYSMNNNINTDQHQHQVQGSGSSKLQRIGLIAGQLALGVASNILFGTFFPGFN